MPTFLVKPPGAERLVKKLRSKLDSFPVFLGNSPKSPLLRINPTNPTSPHLQKLLPPFGPKIPQNGINSPFWPTVASWYVVIFNFTKKHWIFLVNYFFNLLHVFVKIPIMICTILTNHINYFCHFYIKIWTQSWRYFSSGPDDCYVIALHEKIWIFWWVKKLIRKKTREINLSLLLQVRMPKMKF